MVAVGGFLEEMTFKGGWGGGLEEGRGAAGARAGQANQVQSAHGSACRPPATRTRCPLLLSPQPSLFPRRQAVPAWAPDPFYEA